MKIEGIELEFKAVKWDDFGYKTKYDLTINNSRISLKIINESDEKNTTLCPLDKIQDFDHVYMVFFESLDDVNIFNNLVKNKGKRKKIFQKCKFADAMVEELKLLEGANDSTEVPQEIEDIVHCYNYSITRFGETRNYIDKLLKTHQSQNIKFTHNEIEYKFNFKDLFNYNNRTIAFIGKNGSRKSTLLKELYYSYSTNKGYDSAESYEANFQIDKNGFNQSKSLFIQFGLFDDVESQAKNYEFHISSMIKEANIELMQESCSSHNYEYKGEDYQDIFSTYFSFSDKIRFSKDKIITDFSVLSTGEKYCVTFFLSLLNEIGQNSLIFIDELEVSQHPNQIIQMQQFLNWLLEETKSYAILATHSPYLIQNIPVCMVREVTYKSGSYYLSTIPFETFGMSYDKIANYVFNVDLQEKPFVGLIEKMSKEKRKEVAKRLDDNDVETSLLLRGLIR